MKIYIQKLVLFSTICLLSINVFAGAFISNPIHKSDSLKVIKLKNPVDPEERYLKYPRSILVNKFDFQVDAISKGKFTLQFSNNTSNKFIGIKVYDVIGNLLISEKVFVNPKAQFMKEYDFSSNKSGLFIIEVGSSNNNNKTKSVMAAG